MRKASGKKRLSTLKFGTTSFHGALDINDFLSRAIAAIPGK